MEGKYIYNNGTLETTASVIPVMQSHPLGADIAFNISHTRSGTCWTPELAQAQWHLDDMSSALFLLYRKLLVDQEHGSFTFGHPFSFRIHVQGKHTVGQLDNVSEVYRHRKAFGFSRELLDKDKFSALTPYVLEKLVDDPTLAPYIKAHLPQKQQPYFIQAIHEACTTHASQNRSIEHARDIVAHMKPEVEALQALGIAAGSLQYGLDTIAKKLKDDHRPGWSKLSTLVETKVDVPECMDAPFSFASVRRLSTTLHTRANPGYHPDIVTYEITEPRQHYLNRVNLLEGLTVQPDDD